MTNFEDPRWLCDLCIETRKGLSGWSACEEHRNWRPALPAPDQTTTGPCFGVNDGMDGYCIHNENCRYAGQSYTGPNTHCVGREVYG